MERYTADLHIHSRFSRATSKNLTIRNLAAWARVKGLNVLGTGDFTHPAWVEEIENELVEDQDSGLYMLKTDSDLHTEIPGMEGPTTGKVRFMLQAEISSIYKKGGKTRKVHNLVFMPDLDSVVKLNAKLDRIGNLQSDGRPILGLDSRNLLEIVLETSPMGFVIPAHIWTPWFSLFGSKSGFDSIKECFEDLSHEIFAMETGLSSDPEMNWTWSELDRIKLISNSDAHSGEKLGREANFFRGEMSYQGIYRALKGEGVGNEFLGTVEFFPEEGKYHMDGHRKCGISMDPMETKARGGICPVCGKPVTRGVYARVLDLADREQPQQPVGAPGFVSLIPLKEVVSEVLGVGPGSKKVHNFYLKLMEDFGSELNVLRNVPPEELKRHNCHLAEGITRMREGKVIRKAGYDGEFGVISVFTPQEKAEIKNGATLINIPVKPKTEKSDAPLTCPPSRKTDPELSKPISFNPAQQAAIDAGPQPVLVLAGPGTGKTQTLMGRVTRLLDAGEHPRRILCLTFTRRAAGELRERLRALRGPESQLPQAGTLHSLCFDYWKHAYSETPVVVSEEAARKLFAETNPDIPAKHVKHYWAKYNLLRERLEDIPEDLYDAHINYGNQKNHWNLLDYTDLLEFMLEQTGAPTFRLPYTNILVDEVQDLTPLQLAIIKGMAPEKGYGVFCIGDPKQSIYGFRGAAENVDEQLKEYWPKTETITLEDNYRSGQRILDASHCLFPGSPVLTARKDTSATLHLFEAPDAVRESTWMADRIRHLLGATSHSLADAMGHGSMAPGDIAVLVRFKALIGPIQKQLSKFGVPVAAPETEAFWNDPRCELILNAAGSFLGMTMVGSEEVLDVPEQVLAKGPIGLSAYLNTIPPFDTFFWESKAFRELKKEFDQRGGWAGLLNWVSLQNEMELVSRSAEKVQIMTLHAAKGLEFDAVFLPSLEEGIMPFAGMDLLTATVTLTPGRGQRFHEERRLMYVGMTRARKMLYMSYAQKRQLYGKTLQLPTSRYLKEIPEEMLTRSTLAATKVTKAKQMSLLD